VAIGSKDNSKAANKLLLAAFELLKNFAFNPQLAYF
jgi:hypothetical protein